MRATRFASPEGWQVSVRCSLIGVERGAVVDGGCGAGPVPELESAGARALGPFLGVVLEVCCWGRGEQC